jgi:hypothetical protein
VSPEHNVGDVVIVRKWAHHLHQKLIRTLQLPDKSSVDEYYDESVDFPNKFYGGMLGLLLFCLLDFVFE